TTNSIANTSVMTTTNPVSITTNLVATTLNLIITTSDISVYFNDELAKNILNLIASLLNVATN
ncbi:3969_t:CDS:1, partial [Dentiscutata heterogama]